MRERPYFHSDNPSGPTKAESELRLTEAERFLADVYTRRAERPDIAMFDHVSAAERHRDQVAEKELAARYDRTGDVRNDTMEAFLASEIEMADWFEASVFRTTRYDDYKNGVDLVLEWDREEGEEPLRLAVDVTTATSPEGVEKKLAKLKFGSRVKYFESDIVVGEDGEPEQVSLTDLPTIILGIEREYLSTLAKEALEYKTVRKGTDEYGRTVSLPDVRRDAFKDHPLGIVLLEQAKAQLGLQVQSKMNEVVRHVQQLTNAGAEVKDGLRAYAAASGNTDAMLEAIPPLYPTIRSLAEQNTIPDGLWNRWIERTMLYRTVQKRLEIVSKQNSRASRTAGVLARGSGLHRRLTTFAAA